MAHVVALLDLDVNLCRAESLCPQSSTFNLLSKIRTKRNGGLNYETKNQLVKKKKKIALKENKIHLFNAL